MNSEATALTSSEEGAVFALLDAFAEAADAKLRGNAVYALAALVESPRASISERAREQLVALIGMESGGTGPEWTRRFASRAIDALRSLPDQEFERCRGLILTQCSEGPSAAQRGEYARFSLVLDEFVPPARPHSWLQSQRLLWHAGRPGFWWSVWGGAWRCVIVGLMLMVVAILLVPDITSTEVMAHLTLATGASSLLAVTVIGGRFRQGLQAKTVDVLICAVFFALLAALATFWSDDVIAGHEVWLNALLGLLVGALLRSRKWLAGRSNSSMLLAPWEPLVYFCAATLLFEIAAFAGRNAQALAAAWITLAPTAATLGWLDGWLLRMVKPPMVPPGARTENPWKSVAPAVLLVGAAIGLGGANWMNNVGFHPLNRAPFVPTTVSTVVLPDDIQSATTSPFHLAPGERRRVQIKQEAGYRFSAYPVEGKKVQLILTTAMDFDDPAPATSIGDKPATIEQVFPVGPYSLCLREPPDSESDCDQSPSSKMYSMLDFGTALLTRKPPPEPISKPAVLTISPSDTTMKLNKLGH
jgi:hypothetical protein